MKGKEIKTLRFSGFLRIFKATLFAFVALFFVSNAHAECSGNYKTQDNVFSNRQNCSTGTSGYLHAGNSQTNSPILNGDGTWQSNFSTFRIKGRAYCSNTVPESSASVTGSCDIPRRPTADSIDTSNSGTQCWCQATEHQQFSSVSLSWAAPFQKIYAKYVYFKDMGEKCANLCAEYCSYISSNVLLDASVNNTIASSSLRATIYDSLDECIPTENKITYISVGDVIDYQYYNTGSLTLKEALKRNDYSFKGWCETEDCENPLAAGATETNWSGEKTLYAKWERNSCETGTKSSIQSGNLVCTAECADGYETQLNPFSGSYAPCGTNSSATAFDYSDCRCVVAAGRSGNTISGSNWVSRLSNYSAHGKAFCSPTEPVKTTEYDDCSVPKLPVQETISTDETGKYCWCKVEKRVQDFTVNYPKKISAGTTVEVDANYVFVYNYDSAGICSSSCAARCATLNESGNDVSWTIPDNHPYLATATTSESLRSTVFKSVKKCELGKYTITFKDGDETVRVIPEYTIETPVTLLPPDSKTGFVFAGWCEDLSNCDNPMIGETSGLFGDVTLYAKWENNLYNAKFYYTPVVRTRGAAANSVLYDTTVVAYDKPVELSYESPVSGYKVVKYISDHDLETNEEKETEYLPGPTIAKYKVDGDTEFTVELAEILTFECKSGEYLPAGAMECSPCPSGFICPGGPFEYDETQDHGIETPVECESGQYLSNNECLPCPDNYPDSDGSTGCYVKCPVQCTDHSDSCDYDSHVTDFIDYYDDDPDRTPCAIESVNCSSHYEYNLTKQTCVPHSYTITYMDKEDEISGLDPASYTVESETIELPIPTKSGYEFTGWYTDADFLGEPVTQITSGSTGNKTFYSKWAKQYNITYYFDQDKSEVFDRDVYTVEDEDITELPTPEKSKFRFDGWRNAEDDELVETIDTSISKDLELYATWTRIGCDDGYYLPVDTEVCQKCPDNFPNSDGLGVTDGTCYAKCPQEIVSCPEHSVCEYDTYVDNNIDYKTMTNHEPCGIVVTDCQKGYALSNGVCVLDPESSEDYTITYNTNGGELPLALAAPYSFTAADLPISLTNVIPSKSGYSFKGWCDNEDLTIGCSLNKTISSEGNIELYAKWARENYTITYYNGDKVVSASYLPGQYTYGAGITSLPDLEEPYYSFGGWFDENGVKVTEIPSNATGDKQLYAQLAPIEYSLTFKTNFSEKSSGEYTIDDVGEALPALPETVAGYNVRGWYTSAGYETANFSKVTTDLLDYARSATTASDDTSSAIKKLTLYADAGYTGCKDGYDAQPTASAVLDSMINIELSDDNVAVAYKKLNSNTKQTADALPLVNNNAPNGIWGLYIDSAYGIYGTSMCSTDQGTAPSNAMMYSTGNDINSEKGNACWCKMTKYFMYDEDAASPLDATGTPWVYLKEYENSDIGNQNCLDSCTISCYRAVAADKSFRNQLFGEYSLCKLGVYDITYVLNGGEFDSGIDVPEQYTVVYKDVTIPNNVSRGDYYTFDGWCTDSELTNCSKTRTIPTGSYGDKTFYAKWSPEQYSITYNIGDGASWAGDVHPTTYTYGQTITISNPLRNGYNFVGWCDNAENNCGDNELQKPFIINNKSGNITLFARWEIEEYPINYLECTPYDDASCTDTAIREYLLEVASLPSVYRLGDSTPLPQPYEQDYYNFAGWCVDAKSCALNSTISSVNPTWTGAKNLYTKWSPKTYTVYYRCEEDGETIDRTLSISYGQNYDINDILGGNIQISQLCSLPDGYEFDGWDCPCKHQYNKEDETSGGASAGGTASGGGSGSGSATDRPIWDTGSTTCTLKRKPINYTITYHLNGGDNNAENPETYNVQSDTFSLQAPTKSKHDFVAWCIDEQLTQNCESNPIITKGTIGNKDFYAKWVSTACEDGYYLDNANCQKCPDAFPYSNGDSAITKDSCYAICTASRLSASCSVAAENACTYKYTDDNLCANELHLPTNYSLESCGNGYYVEMLGNRQSDTQSCQVVMTGCQEHYNLSGESCVADVYSITYYDGEENITESKNLNPKTHIYGKSTTLPSIIFKEHNNFAGWYNNSALEGDAVSTIAADNYTDDINGFKFYAKWTPVFCATDEIEVYENNILVCKPTKYTIEYHYDNKIETQRANFTDNVNLKTLDDKTGYIFANWCVDRTNCGIQNGVLSLPANTITETTVRLYPQWNVVNYAINYENMQNATWPNGRPIYTYNIESDDIYIGIPKKNGFEFDGWCDADMENCSKNVTIPTGSTGSKTFYAKWTEIEEFECESGRWLHIDNDVNAKACLSLTKVGSPAVVVQVGKTPYYLQMTENPNVSVNEDYNTKLRVRKGNKTFNVHDASVGN